ncbi:ABC transporter ATP-binding protein [Lachnospiraceae bacterium 45-P1]
MFGFGKTRLSSYVTESVSEELIRLDNLLKIYDTGAIKVMGLKKINLAIRRGEFVAIMGHSGSGKSTLMNILGCLDRPTMGHYYLDGIDTADLSPNELSAVRNLKIGFVFQSFNLISRTSALKNVELPMTYARLSRKKRTERARELLECVGLGARAFHMPNELSGGQRQRVAIARALANEPPLILADEPTGNLDTAASIEIMEIFSELHKAGATVVVVTHEENIAAFTDRIIRFSDGQIISDEKNENPTPGSGVVHTKGLYKNKARTLSHAKEKEAGVC